MTDHGPDCMADGLADGAADEDDVRNAQDWSPAQDVAQHTGDKASEECAEGGGGGDEFLEGVSLG